MRVLDWILERCRGNAAADETPIGYLPAKGSLNVTGLDLDDATLKRLTEVEPAPWLKELDEIEAYLQEFGDRLPTEITDQVEQVRQQLNQAASSA